MQTRITISSWCGTHQATQTADTGNGPSLALAAAALLAAAYVTHSMRDDDVMCCRGHVTVTSGGSCTAAGTTLAVPLDSRDCCRDAMHLAAELANRLTGEVSP